MNIRVTMLQSDSPNISIGRHVYSPGDTKFWTFTESDTITIGSFCSFASEVCFVAGGMHDMNAVTTYPLTEFLLNQRLVRPGKGIIVENDVWIGLRATIMSGVTLHNGCVVGAGSVVTHDVDPYTIVAGNPARVIGQRFDGFMASVLEEIAWWNWPIEEITQCAKMLNDPESVSEFIRYAENRAKSRASASLEERG